MDNKRVLIAIAYAINYAIYNAHDIQEQGDDTDAAHAEFMKSLRRGQIEIESLIAGDTIASIWSIEDVFTLMFPDDNPDRGHTDDEIDTARKVLQAAESGHDASLGINWDTLQYHVDEVLRV